MGRLVETVGTGIGAAKTVMMIVVALLDRTVDLPGHQHHRCRIVIAIGVTIETVTIGDRAALRPTAVAVDPVLVRRLVMGIAAAVHRLVATMIVRMTILLRVAIVVQVRLLAAAGARKGIVTGTIMIEGMDIVTGIEGTVVNSRL